MIAIVEIYIHIRKNKEVKINPPTNIRGLMILSKAYQYANDWMTENNCKISRL